ncbi:MAG: rhomboid family intramembrane serine protease [Planctomycetaceae bacterium]|nr:rhomboid family intramembrane serine protease [Planctomycetaceae bacterium]
MGLSNRPYWHGGGGGGGMMSPAFPRPTRTVLILLIANGAMFVLQAIGYPYVLDWLDLSARHWWQIWRFLSFQFLHENLMHLAMNMLGLYFVGMVLESAWGSRRFLAFYLICGVVGGLVHVVVSSAPVVGASGGVLAIVVACALLFPHLRLIFIIIPLPIRVVAVVLVGMSAYQVLSELGGHAAGDRVSGGAHLGGAIAGAIWVYALPRLQEAWQSLRRGGGRSWERKMQNRADERQEIDRILAKVHQQGLNSLTSGEKKTLAQASQRQREQDKDVYRA